jgi:hypothetical protein
VDLQATLSQGPWELQPSGTRVQDSTRVIESRASLHHKLGDLLTPH